MTTTEWQEWIGIVGSIASVVALPVAAVQTVRLRDLKLRTTTDLASMLKTSARVLARIEIAKGTPPGAKRDELIAEGYARAGELYCIILRHVRLQEPKFNQRMIDRWRQKDLINNDWQESQAKALLPTDAVETPEDRAEKRDRKARNWLF